MMSHGGCREEEEKEGLAGQSQALGTSDPREGENPGGGRQPEEKGEAAEIEGSQPAAQDGPAPRQARTCAKTPGGRDCAVYPAVALPSPLWTPVLFPFAAPAPEVGEPPCSGPWGAGGCLPDCGGEMHPFRNTEAHLTEEKAFSPPSPFLPSGRLARERGACSLSPGGDKLRTNTLDV